MLGVLLLFIAGTRLKALCVCFSPALTSFEASSRVLYFASFLSSSLLLLHFVKLSQNRLELAVVGITFKFIISLFSGLKDTSSLSF